MAKHVFSEAQIILGGKDISPRVERWHLGARVGELYVAEIDIHDTPRVIRITEQDARLGPTGIRISRNAKVEVREYGDDDSNWVDISAWVQGYSRIVQVNEIDIIRLHVQADREVLSINGTHPWEYQRATPEEE